MRYYLIFDVETTGLPKYRNRPSKDIDNWPRCVQIAWSLHWFIDEIFNLHINLSEPRRKDGDLYRKESYLVKPDGYSIPYNSTLIHGVSNDDALENGKSIEWILDRFYGAVVQSEVIIAHNLDFDLKVIEAEFFRLNRSSPFHDRKQFIDTMKQSMYFCDLKNEKNELKWPSLDELHIKLFDYPPIKSHDAEADVATTSKCFFELKRKNIVNVFSPYIRTQKEITKQKKTDLIVALVMAAIGLYWLILAVSLIINNGISLVFIFLLTISLLSLYCVYRIKKNHNYQLFKFLKKPSKKI